MLRKLFFLILFVCTINYTFCQTEIIGILINTEKLPIEFASVALLNPKDSTLVNYTITDDKGFFRIIEPKQTTVVFQASSMGFKQFYRTIKLEGEIIDLKSIILKDDINALDEIMISAVIPIQIKQDTVAYNASSFKVNSDDTLESLLEKLPNVEIDSDGKVIAQGEQVTRIFVDGKEFFGGDPAIVLKNLSADAISKVEVIDKKSDEAELTGVDDGNKQVIINFSLKKNRKNQGFGKFSIGSGLDSRYFSNLNYNRFNSKTQISVVGKFNNINVTGSNIKGFLENANGIGDDSDDEVNSFENNRSLSGFLTTGVTGIHVGHEFKKKQSLNTDYFYNYLNNKGLSLVNRINFASRNNFNFNSDNNFDNTTSNHNFNFNYEDKSHKTHTIRITGSINSDDRKNLLDRQGRFINDMDELITTNTLDLETNNERHRANISANFYKRLQKRGRNFNVGVNVRFNNRILDNSQNTLITRNIGQPDERQTERFTYRDEDTENTQLIYHVNYSEPLWANNYLKIRGMVRNLNDVENAFQLRNNIDNNDEEIFNFKFENTERRFQTRILHNYSKDKWFLSYGTELEELNRIFGAEGELPIRKTQFYFNPLATIQYKPKRGIKHRFAYRRQIRSPRSQQITTVVNNLNPFFIRKGNPNLKTEKTDIFALNTVINSFKSSLNFYSKIEFQYVRDAIVSNVVIDEDFVRNRTYDNVKNTKRLNTTVSFSKKIKKLGIRYTLKNVNTYATSNAVVNLELNDVTSEDYLFSLTFENSNKTNFDIKTGASINVNNTAFSLVDDLDRQFSRQQYFAAFDFDITAQLNLSTQLDYFIFKDNRFNSNQELPIWNAALSYSFSRNNILKILLIDILDKNVDIFRRSTVNYFEETTTESLGRYVILSYTYKLNGGKKQERNKKS
ncbi:Outer membrane receptor proteins, mostly Fe transport [Hyunsoonleella jejuensis]|uniref:Outer membrane receptor proteins, mostly Fe transport n=1 Tax=Hyunsoonleella jejuensis TaxID=419940 RepID=A0A1H9L5F1_9FLAO|nr:outer membrane beta-barrel protein [Hyunsoonleella jejuensis]SER06558.1 Outer membrane receptor proteins, mostly Fe transport [Hyunsoonleella jejuensis]